MKVSMYVITHKKFNVPEIDGYIPIQVGVDGKENLGYLKDNIGDNISAKNANYCELTGIYWIWKNDTDSDIIGISHYRRYFKSGGFWANKQPIDIAEINNIMKKHDIVVAKKEIYGKSSYAQYCQSSGFAKDLDKVRDIIKNKYDIKYVESFDEVMRGNLMSQFNMMITTKKLYNQYCKWLFDILFELEKEIDLKDYNDYQRRIYGFLAERLLNIWLVANSNLRIKNLAVINTESTLKEKIRIRLRRVKNYLRFKMKRKDVNEKSYN